MEYDEKLAHIPAYREMWARWGGKSTWEDVLDEVNAMRAQDFQKPLTMAEMKAVIAMGNAPLRCPHRTLWTRIKLASFHAWQLIVYDKG